MCETYNGWTNRETWALMLNITNDQGLADTAKDVCDEARFNSERADIALRDWVDGLLNWESYEFETGSVQSPELVKMSQDVGSLFRVNWSECVESLSGALVS